MPDTLMLEARRGGVPEEVEVVARSEGVDAAKLVKALAQGRVVIPRNVRRRSVRCVGIGEMLSTKVNVNFGTSGHFADLNLELEKARVAVEYGADTVMDLSTGGDLAQIRRQLMKASEPLPLVRSPLTKPGSREWRGSRRCPLPTGSSRSSRNTCATAWTSRRYTPA
jgi:phosphomethylpyrimidine synthase